MKIHESITPKAAKLLQRVAKRIVEHHEEYEQGRLWGKTTPCCFVGHARIIVNRIDAFEDELFNMEKSNRVCGFPFSWPEPFAHEYEKARTSKGRARVGYRRIMHYLKTGE